MQQFRYLTAGALIALFSAASVNAKEACPSPAALKVKISAQYQDRYGALDVDALTLLWQQTGAEFWDMDFGKSERRSSPQEIIRDQYKNGRNGYPKSEKTEKALTHLIRVKKGWDPNGKVPKSYPKTPPKKAVKQVLKKRNCKIVKTEDRQRLLAKITTRRAAELASRPACLLGVDLAEQRLDPSAIYKETSTSGAVGILNWALEGETYWKRYYGGDDVTRQARIGAAGIVKKGVWDAVPPIPPNTELYEAIRTSLPSLKKWEDLSRPIAHPGAKYPSPEMVAWAEDELNCRLDKSKFGNSLSETIKAVNQENDAAELAKEAFNQKQAEAKQRARADLLARRTGRWQTPPTSREEPRGGVKETTNRIGYRGYPARVCAGYYNGLKEKPVLTDFEYRWGAWYTFYKKPNAKCLYRPVERFYTVAEREQQRIQARLDEDARIRAIQETEALRRQAESGGTPSAATNTGIGPAPATPFGNSERDRDNWEKYKENQRCSNPTATGC